MKHRFTLLACASVFAGLTGANAAGDKPAADKPKTTLSKEDRKAAEDHYLFPSPSDALSALQHSAKVDWKALASQIEKADAGSKTAFPEDSQKALNIGLHVADAFVAVEAKDKDLFDLSSGKVSKLATELSADTNLPAQREKAKKLIDDGSWTLLGNLLDTVRKSVMDEFEAATDKDSATLANLGGWLRGLDLISGVLSANYTADATKVLRQPGLVAYLKDSVDKLGAPAKDGKAVEAIKAKLPEIETLCTFDAEGTLAQDKVKQLHAITSELIQAIKK